MSIFILIFVLLLVLIFVLFRAHPAAEPPLTGPLSSAYQPAIDKNCSHSQYASNIWMTNTMQKVRQDSGRPASNACYLTVYGTQNEFVDFQVHFHDTGGGTPDLSVTVSSFVQSSPASSTIANTYRSVLVYREAYIDVTTKTAYSSTYYGSTGYYPDILIPTVDPYHDQTTNAWPFTVAAGNNQSAWIDVLVPPAAPSGYYLGSVTVKSGSTTLATMPVVIGVWQWPSAGHMPSTATLKSYSSQGFDDMCTQTYGGYTPCSLYPGAAALVATFGGNQSDAGCELGDIDVAVLALDHRYSVASVYANPLTAPNAELVAYYGPLYNGGGAYQTTQPILSGAKLQQAMYPFGATNGGQPSSVAQNWADLYKNNGWTKDLFAYSCDEPRPLGEGLCGESSEAGAWAAIASNATLLHGVTPPIPALVTTDIATVTAESAQNDIDWMVVGIDILEPQFGSLTRSSYNTWLAGNCCGGSGPARELWSYQSCSSAGTCSNGTEGSGVTYPNYDVDGVPAANRAMEWMTFLHQQSAELYYLTTLAWEGGNDPWNSVYYYGGNGDGTLLYPSTGYNGSSFTNHVTAAGGGALTDPIYLPSIRLKHIRDGMQDYEYLNVLTNNGQSALVSTEIASWITNSYTFETSGSGLEAARLALGNAMQRLSYPPLSSPLAPTNVATKVRNLAARVFVPVLGLYLKHFEASQRGLPLRTSD